MWNCGFIFVLVLECQVWNALCQTSEAPFGHLLPLGLQRPPSVDIDEFTVDTAPDPQTFYNDYVKASRAAVFRGAMKETKAFKTWTDEYISKNYGGLEVRIEGKKEKVHMTPIGEKYLGRDNLRHFIENYHLPTSKTYIVSELPKQMFHEVGVLPSVGACGEMTKRFVEIDLWWSGGASASVIHKDAYNQINCLYRGTKYWKLFEYKYEKWIHKHLEPEHEIGGFSDINVEAVDMIQHPNIAKVPWSNLTIHAGDCLFLPKSYYHQVNSDGPNNLAVSILFSRMDNKTSINTSDCNENTDYKKARPLSDFDVMWQWPGTGVMSMGFGDLEENFRQPLLADSLELEKEGKSITADFLREIFVLDDSFEDQIFLGDMDKAVAAVDANDDGQVTSDELRSANYSQLARLGFEVEVYEPSNTYDFEYSFLSYDEVMPLLQWVLDNRERLTRDQWVKAYMNRLHGTKHCANEIFTGLVQSEDINELTCKDITKEDVKRSLKNWLKYWVPQYSGHKTNPNDDGSDEDQPRNDDVKDEL